MIDIDGRLGEGGGQVLRTSLALSAITGQAMRLHHIRGRRGKPGLLRQHLTAVRAAAVICGADVTGDAMNSSEVTFIPGEIKAGLYEFDIGSAGSVNLVLQTLVPMLMMAQEVSAISLRGGTHNPASPNSDFLKRVFAPALSLFGPELDLTIKRYGFYPAGGGLLKAHLTPHALKPAYIPSRECLGELVLQGRCSRTNTDRIERLAELVKTQLNRPSLTLDLQEVESLGPGWVIMAHIDGSPLSQLFTLFEQKKISMVEAAQSLTREIQTFLTHEASVDEHLADQLLVPIALAGGGSFVTTTPSLHTTTNIEVISRFLPVKFSVSQHSSGATHISL